MVNWEQLLKAVRQKTSIPLEFRRLHLYVAINELAVVLLTDHLISE